MIENSFIFLEKIGEKTEKNLWNNNIHSWHDFLNNKTILGVSRARKIIYDLHLTKALKNLKVNNADYFTHSFPRQHHWRLFDKFKDEAVYLDIETSGYYGDITVIGLYDGFETNMFVRGFNLDKHALQKTLDRYKMIITFNGASFDLPVIKKYFNLNIPHLHIDLRHVCSQIGLTGGLKKIEKTLNISRAKEVEDVSGMEAVYLWQQFKATGNKKYLDLLVKYNEEDIVNLKPLAEYAIPELWNKIRNVS